MAEDKIGNYIHWKYDNYLHYSTGTKEHPNSLKGEDALDRQRTAILNEVKNNKSIYRKNIIKNQLLERLNFFYATGNSAKINGVTYSAEDIARMKNTIIQIVQAGLSKSQKFNFDFLTGGNPSRLELLSSTLKGLETSGTNQISAINKRLGILLQMRAAVGQNNIAKKRGGQQWLNELDALMAEMDAVEAEVMKMNTASQAEIQNKFINVDEIYSQVTNKKMKENFATRLNRIWKQAQRNADSYLTGKVGEWFMTLALNACNGYGRGINEKLLNDLLTQVQNGDKKALNAIGLVGGDVSAAVKVTSNFAISGRSENYRGLVPDYFTSFGDYATVETHSTQDKVDLQVNLNGQNLNASIKNYDLSDPNKKIHILSGADILNYVQEYGTFVNHYLNMTASGNTSISQRNGSSVVSANNVLLLTLTLKALIGNVYKLKQGATSPEKSDMAEILIVHDNSIMQGGFNVYFIDDIINNLMTTTDNLFSLVEIRGLSENTTWPMFWYSRNREKSYENAYRRIMYLLQSLSAFKLSISISPTTFK